MEPLKPEIKSVRALSPVWIIPIVTFLVGAWLAVHGWQERGTEVEILFDDANGITVGQTQVRLKDVPVGKVTGMHLSSDLSKVRVTVSVDRQVSHHLSENSRFWLVSPRVSASGVSNLGTLISGVYLVMDPGEPGEFHTTFKGLTEPPAVKSDDKGTQFLLLADQLGSLDIGSPVYYRSVKVGEVTGYKLGESGSHVEIRIFIQAPHDKIVYTRTHFWNVSGFGFSIGADGFKAQMASLASLISGGVSFENTIGFHASQRANDNHRFNLYPDKQSIADGRYTLRYYYLMKFSHSVRGLSVGAPVEFRGIKVGEVHEIQLSSVARDENSLHVMVAIEPQRLDSEALPTREQFDQRMEKLVNEGLRAQLRNSSLLTGARFVALVFPNELEPSPFVRHDQYSEIPTKDAAANQLDQELAEIASKVNTLPIKALGDDLAKTISHLSQLLATLDEQKTMLKLDTTLANTAEASENFDATMQQFETTLKQVAATLRAVEGSVSEDSATHLEFNQMLKAVRRAAESLEGVMLQLQEKPDALLFGDDHED